MFDTRASRITLGVYAQADYDITPELSINAGARVDIYSGSGILADQRFVEFNPRGGIVYKNAELGIFKVSYGRAMRVPNGFEALSSVTILGNPERRPERIQTAQATWIRTWSDNIRTEFGGFFSSISNRLITDAKISDELKAQGFIGQFVNVANNIVQQSSGLDGKILAKFASVDASLNVTQMLMTNNGAGRVLPYIPMTMVNANVNFPVEWLNINLGANYRGEFTKPADDPRPSVPAYLLLNAVLSGKPFDAPFEFRLGIRNALNAALFSPSSNLDFVEHFRNRQVEGWLEISYRFE